MESLRWFIEGMETIQKLYFTQGSGTPVLKELNLASVGAMPAMESTFDGRAIAWPLDPNALFLLYQYCAEHQRCCHIKAECAYGGGMKQEGRLPDLLPDGTGAVSFCVSLGLDLETYGNAFVEVIRAGSRVVGLRRLPARTLMRCKGGGFAQWAYEVDGDLVITYFTDDEVVWLHEPCAGGLHYALPTWIGAHGMIELVYASVQFNAAYFRNRAIPDYAIIVNNGMLTDAAKAKIKEFFQQEYMGLENAHRALYVPAQAGMEVKFEKLTEHQKDADFLKLMDASRDRIIMAHGVPPRMLGIMASGQLGGGGEVEGQLKVFESITLRPKRRRFSEQLAPLMKEIGMAPLELLPLDLDPDKPGSQLNPETPQPPAPQAPDGMDGDGPDGPPDEERTRKSLSAADLAAMLAQL